MSASAYPTDGSAWIKIQGDVATLNLVPSKFAGTGLEKCTVSSIASISMASSADEEKHILRADAAECTTLDDKGDTILKTKYSLEGLSIRTTHYIATTIRFMGRNTGDTVDSLKTIRFGAKFDVYGPMLTPAIKELTSFASSGFTLDADLVKNGDGVTLLITPNDNENENKLLNDFVSEVEITANDDEENSHTFVIPHAADGKYSIVDTGKLILGKTYYFTCQMISGKGDVSPMSESKTFKIVDTVSPSAGKLAIYASDGADANLVIASHIYTDQVGMTADAADSHRASHCVLRWAVVPANRIDQNTYSPLTYQTKEFEMNPYDSDSKSRTLPKSEVLLPNCRGLMVVGQYAIRNLNGVSEWSDEVRQLVPAAVPAAPVLVVSESAGKFTVEPEISQSTQGLVLIGYEFSVVNENDDETDLGTWTLDSKEVIIAGGAASASVTAASFNGIVGQGEKVLPAVAQRSVKAEYTHAGTTLLTPYFKLRSRGVYGNAGDFNLTNLTKEEQSYSRSDFSFTTDNNSNNKKKLMVHANAWYDTATKTEVYGEWATSELKTATVALPVTDAFTPTYTTKDGKVYAAISIPATASHKTFATARNGELAYYIREKVSNKEQYLVYDRHEQKYMGEHSVPAGDDKHEYVLGARVFLGDKLIGKSAELAITGVPMVSGRNRKAVSGRYTVHLAALATTEDLLLAHTDAAEAKFAIETTGKRSEDHDLPHLTDDASYSQDFKMAEFESFNAETGKWEKNPSGVTATTTEALKQYTDEKKHDITKKYVVIKVTGLAALTRYRCNLFCHFKHSGADRTKDYVDRLPRQLEFVATESFAAPTLNAVGIEGAVLANFSMLPASEDLSEAEKKAIFALGGLHNDVYLNGAKVAAKSSSEEEFTVAVSGTSASVVGARSYANPNASINNGLVLVDAVRVSSATTDPQIENVAASPAAAAGVSVSTSAAGALRILRKKGDADSFFHVRVTSEDDSVDNLDRIYSVGVPTWDETTPVSDSVQADITHTNLQSNLGLAAGKKFMEANLKVSVIASTNSVISDASRQSAPVTVSYSPKSAPTLDVANFTVERLPSTLRVSLKDLNSTHRGGFATLPVKIRATHSTDTKIVYGNTQNDILTLGSALTIDFGAMVSGSYKVECEVLDIEGEVFKVAKTIDLGSGKVFTPGSALLAAKKFKVARKVGALATDAKSLVVSWEAADLNGWTLSSSALYVTGEDAAGKQIWYSQPTTNPTTGALDISYEEKAHGATISTTSGVSSATIDRLTAGKKYTVTLQSTFAKTGETNQVVRVSDYDVPSIAPEFTHLSWNSNNGILTAYITNNGSAIKQFMLLASYAAGKPLGKVLMNVSLDGLDSIDAAAGSVVRYLIAFDQTKPIPYGILAILMNENGVDAHADPNQTFGVGEMKKNPVYTEAEIAAMKTFKTSAN